MRPILFVNGAVLAIISMPLLLIEMLNPGTDLPFVKAFSFILFVGMGLILANRGGTIAFTHKQIFILTTSIWLTLTAAAALPFWMWGM